MKYTFYLLGDPERVLARVRVREGWNAHEVLDETGWHHCPEAYDLINRGFAHTLPPEMRWAFPGHAREITEEEAIEFVKSRGISESDALTVLYMESAEKEVRQAS